MNETLATLTTRRSAEHFKPEHISGEEIDQIVAAGLNAPSGMNAQDALFLVVQDDATVAKLSELNANVMKASMAKTNPAMANMNIDPFHGAKDVIAVVTRKSMANVYDGSLAMGNLMNAAWSMGIDSRWIHRAKEVFATDEGKAILAKAGITEEVEGIGFCVLGHSAEPTQKKETKPDRVYRIG